MSTLPGSTKYKHARCGKTSDEHSWRPTFVHLIKEIVENVFHGQAVEVVEIEQ